MLRNLIIYSVVLAAITGCSSKYIGKDATKIRANLCATGKSQCIYKTEYFDLNYNFKEVSKNNYKLTGTVFWTNTDISGAYDKIERMKLKFIFMDETKVVEEESVYVRGYMYKKHTFETVISGIPNIKNSLPVAYSYTITE